MSVVVEAVLPELHIHNISISTNCTHNNYNYNNNYYYIQLLLLQLLCRSVAAMVQPWRTSVVVEAVLLELHIHNISISTNCTHNNYNNNNNYYYIQQLLLQLLCRSVAGMVQPWRTFVVVEAVLPELQIHNISLSTNCTHNNYNNNYYYNCCAGV